MMLLVDLKQEEVTKTNDMRKLDGKKLDAIIREKFGGDRLEFSREVGRLREDALSRYIAEKRVPIAHTFIRMLEVLGIPVDPDNRILSERGQPHGDNECDTPPV